jgi:dTDP-4-dehydrorhamnose reductase
VRFLILGGDGMLGHQLYERLRASHETRVTLRESLAAYGSFRVFGSDNAYPGIDVRDTRRVAKVLADFDPQVVVNAVGIVKQRADANESIPSIEINALLPHRLAVLCSTIGARLIHLSTDCVFSGRTGNYSETSTTDPEDLYGRSKLLGEVQDQGCLTLRTSIIGPELRRKTGLLEWFLAQSGTVKGYRNAVFSGFTTLEMSRIIERLAVDFSGAHGLYHVASEPITKYELLKLIKRELKLDVEVVPDDAVRCDRSLDSSRFRAQFGYTPPTWSQMIEELAASIRKAQS